MKKIIIFSLSILMMTIFGCQRDISDLEKAEFSKNPLVFIDEFSAGLNYAAFGGSVPTAFDVDEEVTYNATQASMRIEVPDANDPKGAYAGGVFFTEVGRNLTDYTALTFWIKASKSAVIDVIGFGNDLGANKYQTAINGLNVNTNWQKVIIPIPDPSRLTQEKGMLFYSEGPEEGKGYTFWIDEVQFEDIRTISNVRGSIFGGQDDTVAPGLGEELSVTGTSAIANLPTGVDLQVSTTSAYFQFVSSDTSVVKVNDQGNYTVVGTGEAIVSAFLQGKAALGSMKVNSTPGLFSPAGPVATPTFSSEDVISMFSNAYTNVPIDTWNTRWMFSNAEEAFVKVGDSDVIRYRNLNFVGIEFASNTINASEMTHFHMDIWTPDPTELPKTFKILLIDFGPDGTFDGGDDSSHEVTITSPTLQTRNWINIRIPLTSFGGLASRSNLAQLVLSGDLPTVFVDNVLFYKDGGTVGPTMPTVAAPTPTFPSADVISMFSNAYTNVPVDTWRTDWSAANLQDIDIEGNATKRYAALDFVGIETVMNQLDISEMTHFHMNVWSSNFTSFSIKLVDFGADGAFGGGDDVEHQIDIAGPDQGEWITLDIPLSQFESLTTRKNFAQLIMVAQPTGAATVYVDNVLFRK